MKIHNFCINYSSVANHEREREREKKTPREKKGRSVFKLEHSKMWSLRPFIYIELNISKI